MGILDFLHGSGFAGWRAWAGRIAAGFGRIAKGGIVA